MWSTKQILLAACIAFGFRPPSVAAWFGSVWLPLKATAVLCVLFPSVLGLARAAVAVFWRIAARTWVDAVLLLSATLHEFHDWTRPARTTESFLWEQGRRGFLVTVDQYEKLLEARARGDAAAAAAILDRAPLHPKYEQLIERTCREYGISREEYFAR
jgi:hypothetical protein